MADELDKALAPQPDELDKALSGAKGPTGFWPNAYEHTVGNFLNMLDTTFGYSQLKDAYAAAQQGKHLAAAGKLAEWAEGPAKRIGEGLMQTSLDQAHRAGQAMREGQYTEAIGHMGAATVPPVAGLANVHEQMRKGDVTGGLGAAAGEVASLLPAAMGEEGVGALESGAARSYSKLFSDIPKATREVRADDIASASQALAKEQPVASGLQSMIDQVAAKKAQVGKAAKDAYLGKDQVPIELPLQALEAHRLESVRPRTDPATGPSLATGPQGLGAPYGGSEQLSDLVRAHQEEFLKPQNVKISSKGVPVVDAVTFDDILNRIQAGNVSPSGDYKVPASEAHVKNVNNRSAGILQGIRDSLFPEEVAGQKAYGDWNTTSELLDILRKKEEAGKTVVQKLKVPAYGGLGIGGAYALHYTMGIPMSEALPIGVGASAGLAGLYEGLNSVPWKTVSGKTKAVLASHLADGNWEKAATALAAIKAGLAPQDNEQ